MQIRTSIKTSTNQFTYALQFMAEISQVSEESGGSSRRRAPTTNPCPSTLDSSSLTHTPYYCEENVYFLCKTLCMRGIADHKGTDLFAVFISNEDKKVPLWRQKASERSDGLVIWDYHVICIQTSQEKDNGDARHLVWDIDSSLPCPISLKEYITEAICPSFPLNRKYGRLFRVVHAPLFLQCFASDRSHMKDPSGNWMAPPPAYKPIVAEDGTENNLNEYIKMRAEDILRDAQALLENAFLDIYFNKFGVVISETMLESFFSQMKPLLSLHEMHDV